MEYCTVDSRADAKLSILVRPISVKKRSKYCEENPGEFAVQRSLEDYPCSNLRSCIFHDCDVKSLPSRNSLARIVTRFMGSKTSALTVSNFNVYFNIKNLYFDFYPYELF